MLGICLIFALSGCNSDHKQSALPKPNPVNRSTDDHHNRQNDTSDAIQGNNGEETQTPSADSSSSKGVDQPNGSPNNNQDSCLDTPEKNCQIAAIVLRLTNEFRAQNNLPAFKPHPKLAWLAYFWAIEQGKRGVPSHDGWNSGLYAKVFPEHFNETLPLVRAENAGIAQLSLDIEEVGREMFIMWRDSPPHRKNLLSNYKYMGIGLAAGNPAGVKGYFDWYGTQILTNDEPL